MKEGEKMRVSISASDLRDLYGEGFAYVDKTDFLKEWWFWGEKVTLLTRPRRFGKTLTLSMVNYFFNPLYKGVTKADGEPLFEGLRVWEEEDMRALQGTVPVLSMTLSGAKVGTKEEMGHVFSVQVRRMYLLYLDDLIETTRLSEAKKELVRGYAGQKELADPADALVSLCMLLQDAYGKAPILLLDEYDTPLTEAFLNGTLPEVINPLRSFFVQCYKDNPFFSKWLITGITRIAQQSLFSDFNNPCIDTMLRSDYPTLMGYTQEEVVSLLRQMGMENSLAEIGRMYDGYSIAGKGEFYNPFSVNHFLREKELGRYWIDSSGSSLPKAIISEGAADIKEAVANLLGGESVWTRLPLNLVYEDLYQETDAALSFLFFSGYLKVVGRKREEEEDDFLYEVRIPNREVWLYYKKTVMEWVSNRFMASGKGKVLEFCRALLLGDQEKMTAILKALAESCMGEADAVNNPKSPPENFYHGLVLGIVANLADAYHIRSNIPSGIGRYELSLTPKLKEQKPGEQIRCYRIAFLGREVFVKMGMDL